MFAYKKPCANCPFRKKDGHHFALTKARIEEIVEATAFQCHKTVTDLGGRGEAQQCAGLMALLHKEQRPNTIMQVSERLTEWRASELDGSDVYDSIDEAIAAHAGKGRR